MDTLIHPLDGLSFLAGNGCTLRFFLSEEDSSCVFVTRRIKGAAPSDGNYIIAGDETFCVDFSLSIPPYDKDSESEDFSHIFDFSDTHGNRTVPGGFTDFIVYLIRCAYCTAIPGESIQPGLINLLENFDFFEATASLSPEDVSLINNQHELIEKMLGDYVSFVMPKEAVEGTKPARGVASFNTHAFSRFLDSLQYQPEFFNWDKLNLNRNGAVEELESVAPVHAQRLGTIAVMLESQQQTKDPAQQIFINYRNEFFELFGSEKKRNAPCRIVEATKARRYWSSVQSWVLRAEKTSDEKMKLFCLRMLLSRDCGDIFDMRNAVGADVADIADTIACRIMDKDNARDVGSREIEELYKNLLSALEFYRCNCSDFFTKIVEIITTAVDVFGCINSDGTTSLALHAINCAIPSRYYSSSGSVLDNFILFSAGFISQMWPIWQLLDVARYLHTLDKAGVVAFTKELLSYKALSLRRDRTDGMNQELPACKPYRPKKEHTDFVYEIFLALAEFGGSGVDIAYPAGLKGEVLEDSSAVTIELYAEGNWECFALWLKLCVEYEREHGKTLGDKESRAMLAQLDNYSREFPGVPLAIAANLIVSPRVFREVIKG